MTSPSSAPACAPLPLLLAALQLWRFRFCDSGGTCMHATDAGWERMSPPKAAASARDSPTLSHLLQ